jgi:hypothetical protein
MKEVSKYTYELNLLAMMDIHPVLHVSLLEPIHNDPFPSQAIIPPSPIIVEGGSEYKVEDILDSHIF